MRISYRIKGEGIEILRCYGTDGRITIPGKIEDRPVISAASYAFSVHKSEEETDVCVYETEDALNFAGGEKLLAGNEVEEIVFPDSLREIGRYIFYGCQKLRSLEFSDCLMQIGSGAFTGCKSLSSLKIHMNRGSKSCAKEVLGELWPRMDVTFLYGENTEHPGEAQLVFPQHYEEAVENTPARILFTQYHGSGMNYRQCFYNKKPDYGEYDKLFSMAVVMDKLEVLVDMSFKRLMYPYELSEKSRQEYAGYIKEHLEEIAKYLIELQDMQRMEVISQEKLWDKETIEKAVSHAASKGMAELSAFLMNEKHRFFPEDETVKKRKNRFAL